MHAHRADLIYCGNVILTLEKLIALCLSLKLKTCFMGHAQALVLKIERLNLNKL